MKYLVLAASTALAFGGPANAQCQPVPLGSAPAPGNQVAIAVENGAAYMVAGLVPGLSVMDVSNPLAPTFQGTKNLGGETKFVEVVGDVVYASSGETGPFILDATDPTNPVQIGQITTSSMTGRLVHSGDSLYVVAGDEGLLIFDVADPAKPILIGSFDPGFVLDVAVDGGLAYVSGFVAGSKVIHALDVTNPSVPVLVDDQVLFLPGSLGLVNLMVDGSRLYATHDPSPPGPDSLLVFSLVDPVDPTLVSSTPICGAVSELAVDDEVVFACCDSAQVLLVDVADPGAPTVIGAFDTPGQPNGIAIEDGIAYIADGFSGMHVIDISVCPGANNYCGPGVANSTGLSGGIEASGSSQVALNNLTMRATQLPANQFGFLLTSLDFDFVPQAGGSQGNLCLGGSIVRFNQQIANSGPGGTITTAVDLNDIPSTPSQQVFAGQTWFFQFWHRDQNPGLTSNFTDAVYVDFR